MFLMGEKEGERVGEGGRKKGRPKREKVKGKRGEEGRLRGNGWGEMVNV